jgi:uncharacterized repeat protein (TIGR02543 family)
MKKRNVLIALGALAVLFSGLLTTCGEVYKPKVTGISLNKNTLNLKVGEDEVLIYTTEPSSAKKSASPTWRSDDEDFATVDNGKVTAINTGITTVTATVDNIIAACLVTVCNNIYTVTFDKNHGDTEAYTEANPNKILVRTPYEDDVGKLPTKPYRKGYTFMSWNTKEDGSGTEFKEDTPVNDTNTEDGKITVYAQWDLTYTVIFDKNRKEGIPDFPEPIPPKIDVSADPDTKVGMVPSLPTNYTASFTQNSYKFGGWYTKQYDYGKDKQDNEIIDPLVPSTEFDTTTPIDDTKTVNGKIKVYARWIPYLAP